MIKTGFVKEKKGDALRVCFERPQACEGCHGCAKGLLPKSELLTVYGQAEIGDVVDVQMPEARTLKATMLAYLLPLATTIAGLIIGSACGLADGITALLALAGLALGYGAVRLIDKRLQAQPQWRPTVVSVRAADTQERIEEQ